MKKDISRYFATQEALASPHDDKAWNMSNHIHAIGGRGRKLRVFLRDRQILQFFNAFSGFRRQTPFCACPEGIYHRPMEKANGVPKNRDGFAACGLRGRFRSSPFGYVLPFYTISVTESRFLPRGEKNSTDFLRNTPVCAVAGLFPDAPVPPESACRHRFPPAGIRFPFPLSKARRMHQEAS